MTVKRKSGRLSFALFRGFTSAQRRFNRLMDTVSNKLVSYCLAKRFGSRICYQCISNGIENNQLRWQQSKSDIRLSVVIVTYHQELALDCLLMSLQCQTLQNFEIIVLHDGLNERTRILMDKYKAIMSNRCRYVETTIRYNDYGHTLRDLGIREANGEYILITNGDNYYSPRCFEFVFDAVNKFDLSLVMWNMVHSHGNAGGMASAACSPFTVFPFRGRLDIGAFLVKRMLATEVGFRDKSHDGDASYFEDLLEHTTRTVRIGKIARTLMVHN
ncbi:MAG: glycosyltransferase [Pseudomonadota bacterium]